MRRLIERMHGIRERSSLYARIMAEHPLEGRDPRASCFWMVHNKAIITEEILTMYNNVWRDLPLPSGIDEDKVDEERLERAVAVSRSFFNDTMSVLEHCAMQLLPRYRGTAFHSDLREFSDERRHIYLRDIILASERNGIVDAERGREWHDLIDIRNLSVHNNAISDRSMRCVIGGTRISMRPGRMMKGPITTYLDLAGTVMDHFYEWLDRLEAHGE